MLVSMISICNYSPKILVLNPKDGAADRHGGGRWGLCCGWGAGISDAFIIEEHRTVIVAKSLQDHKTWKNWHFYT